MPTKSSAPESNSSGWTDREILGLDQDRLKFEHYASVLAEIVQEADTPLTIGVFGSWGSGKTSLMRLIKDSLDKSGDKTKFKTLWFDAWTFDKEEALWRAVILLVLKKVREELLKEKDNTDEEKEAAKKKLDDLEASLYRDVDREEMGGVTIDWPKAGKAAASGLTRLSLSLIPGVGTFLAKAVEEAQKQLGGDNLDSLFDAVQRERQKIHREHIASLEQFQLGFAELLRDHFVKKDRRLVVFIDDLDRCLPEKAIGVLEAIKLFLDAPGCVYIVGTDRNVIEQGIRVKYKDFFVGESTEEDESSKMPITGDNYLEKIVQIPFHMPPLQEERIEEYISEYDKSVPKECVAILATGIEPNPRKVKRTINAFRLLHKLADKRVAEKEIDEFVPGLLAKIVVIQSRWRKLYDDLREYPNLIQDLERQFRSGETKLITSTAAQRDSAVEDKGQAKSSILVEGTANAINISQSEKSEALQQPQRTLVEKYAAIKPLGNMLKLPPYFEDLKIDQIQLYLYMTHTVVAEPETKEEVFNVDQRRWDDLLSDDPTRVRAATEAIQADKQAKAYAPSLLNVISGKQQFPTPQRVSAGNALGYLSDPRFREDAWFLPDDPLLGFIEIPAGKFLMGSDPAKDPIAKDFQQEQPQHEVMLPAYLIARYPVTVAQFQVFVKASGHKPADEDSLRGPLNHPVVNVTWHEALAYCDWLSNTLKAWKNIPQPVAEKLAVQQWRITLPSEAEWEKAARGNDGRIYPWGNEFDSDKANVEMNIRSTSAVGCFPAGESYYHLQDMCGNVWEWCMTKWQGNYQNYKDDNERSGNELRALRGGSWFNPRGSRAVLTVPGSIPTTSTTVSVFVWFPLALFLFPDCCVLYSAQLNSAGVWGLRPHIFLLLIV